MMTIEEDSSSSSSIDFNTIKSGKDLIDAIKEQPLRLATISPNLSLLTGEMRHALIGMDGFALKAQEHWSLWKGLLIEFACDGSGHHVALLPVVIKRSCSVLASPSGSRAAELLACIATIMPDCISAQLLVGIEGACPYWKSPASSSESLQFYFQNLLFLAETLPVLQDRILEFLLCRVVLSLDLAVCLDESSVVASNGHCCSPSNDGGAGDDAVASDTETEALSLDANSPADAKLPEKLALCLAELKAFLGRMSGATDRFRDLCFCMIRMFDRSVLYANQPRQTVSVLLWACQLDSVVTDRFLGFLTASLFARDAQLYTVDGQAMSNNAITARVLMTITSIVSSFVHKHGSISSEQLTSTAHLLLQWLERKAEAVQIHRDILFCGSGGGEFLNPLEVSVCAAVWQALFRIILVLQMHHDSMLPLLERVNSLAGSELMSALTLVNDAVWCEFSEAFVDDCQVLAEARKRTASSLKASRSRRQRESLRLCPFKVDCFDTYEPL